MEPILTNDAIAIEVGKNYYVKEHPLNPPKFQPFNNRPTIPFNQMLCIGVRGGLAVRRAVFRRKDGTEFVYTATKPNATIFFNDFEMKREEVETLERDSKLLAEKNERLLSSIQRHKDAIKADNKSIKKNYAEIAKNKAKITRLVK